MKIPLKTRMIGLPRILVVALTSLSMTRAVVAEDNAHLIGEIAADYEKAYRQMDSYSYKYVRTSRSEGIVGGAGHQNAYPNILNCEVMATTDRLKTICHNKRQAKTTAVAYDGRNLVTRPPDRVELYGKSVSIVKKLRTDRIKINYFDTQPLEYCLLGFDLPSFPAEHSFRARFHVPQMLNDFSLVFDRYENLDGVRCVVLNSARYRLWLNPDMSYAVFKRESYIEGQIAFVVRAGEHEEVALGLWIPKKLTMTTFGTSDGDPGLVGRPIVIQDYAISDFSLNPAFSAETFAIAPKAGELVTDQTLQHEDEQGQPIANSPGISYIQPASAAELDAVIAEAKQGRVSAPAEEGSTARVLLIAVNVLIILILAAITYFRWSRKRTLGA